MKYNKDFGYINQKIPVKLPNEWAQVFKWARVKSTPINLRLL